MSGQITLFTKKEDYQKDFQDGEIVVQTWAWIGCFQSIFPFWQVRFSEILDGKRMYCCYAVPYGSHSEIHWFEKKDLKSIGLKWRIPTWEEIDEWCKKNCEQNTYLKNLNQSRRNDDGEWYCFFYPPYPEEKELVDMLNKTGIDYRTVTRDNFEEKMKLLL